MPMLTTVDPLARGPAPRAVAHPVGEHSHPAEHLVHVGHHVVSVDVMCAPAGCASAVCSTARRSVTLIFSPANIASRAPPCPRRGHGEQRIHDRVVDEVLRPVDAQIAGRPGSAPPARGRRRTARATCGRGVDRSADHAGVAVMSMSPTLADRVRPARPRRRVEAGQRAPAADTVDRQRRITRHPARDGRCLAAPDTWTIRQRAR